MRLVRQHMTALRPETLPSTCKTPVQSPTSVFSLASLASVAHWKVNQQREELSHSLILFLSLSLVLPSKEILEGKEKPNKKIQSILLLKVANPLTKGKAEVLGRAKRMPVTVKSNI